MKSGGPGHFVYGHNRQTVTGVNGIMVEIYHNGLPMKSPSVQLLITILVVAGLSAPAHADVWKWIDANGDVHFVNTNTPIYTWVDEDGKVHYSDKPEHKTAVLVDLIWHSSEDNEELAAAEAGGSNVPEATESLMEKLERRKAKKKHCERAREIYESYVKAPALYQVNEQGEREYLTEKEAAAKLAETKAQVAEICR